MSTAFGRRGYAGGAVVTSLLVDVTNSTTSLSTVLASTFPAANFHIVIDEGIAGFEEKIFVGTRTGNNFTGCVRGEDGTAGVAHVAGATIRHILTAQDVDEANAVASVLTTKGDLAIKKAGGATTGWDRLPVGAEGTIAVSRGGQALGLAYEAQPVAVPMTTALRNALAGANLFAGRIVYDTDLNALMAYSGAAWVEIAGLGAWVPYTPTWSGTLGNGPLAGGFRRYGRTITWRASVLWGSTTSHAAASQSITIPVAPVAAYGANAPVGQSVSNQPGTNLWAGAVLAPGASGLTCLILGGTSLTGTVVGLVTNLVPFTWANTHALYVGGSYEAAT